MSDTAGGTYTLLVALSEPAVLTVGALGERRFEAGWYAYVGSANGPGGFSRIDRHRELAAGERDVRHWHVDYLLGHSETTLVAVEQTSGVDGECAVAEAIGGDSVAGFGCSDCGCESHLFYREERRALFEAVEVAHRGIRE